MIIYFKEKVEKDCAVEIPIEYLEDYETLEDAVKHFRRDKSNFELYHEFSENITIDNVVETDWDFTEA
ncbi:hypothetical protein [Anaerococcus cruorum]|uniref:Uncharacterized protein n=1 Tax=Anaerococcus cruorum TaxID=3115617 RepID=A0ABW9MWA8_9FIRM